MRRRDFLEGMAGVGLLAGMAPVPVALADAGPRRGGTLVATIPGEPTHLVSAFDSTMTIGMVGAKVLEGLVTYDLDLNPQPALATAWVVGDGGKSITFTLRQGVKWHDGHDFTSADVAFSMMKVWKALHPFGRAAFATVTGVDTPDAHTAIVRLSAPAQYLFGYLNVYGAQVLPRHIYDGTDILTNPANAAPIGTGPFVFKEWQRGSHVRLARNPSYWRPGLPYLDEVIFRFIPDASARAVAVESGEVQLALGGAILPSAINRFGDKGRYSINTDDGRYLSSITLAFFNTRRPQFADRRVRQAVLSAIDRDALVRLVYRGLAKAATGPVPSTNKRYYTDKVPAFPYDPKRAEALLDEAGFKRKADGTRLSLVLDIPSADQTHAADVLKQQLGKVGVDVQIRASDQVNYLRRIFTDNDFDLSLVGLHMLPDPTLGVQRLYWSKNIVKGAPWTNGSGYANPELDQVMEAAQREPDDAKRQALITRWQEIAATDVPILDLVEQVWVTVATTRLRRPTPQGDGLFDTLADAWLTA
ncbi:ABC transporter substrate-binding protein [Nitrospirillum sp. BR 11163]|uniref:ABC transporter substrate-binding protein n=1 Tax=Nitrospirillum sp. BR 11163 TaxID=3104323 RepID=UPI002AFDF196|nr:ABC transporter substrate-binding protein [Nitrospirillum sp. BR 11163]MEA1674638.1 ABC transporter substrate-binding protein [Nitrospirillum sp. BR 11163]